MNKEKIAEDKKALNRIQSVDRALNIIEVFTESRCELGVTEISIILSLHKSTAFGLLATLVDRGYLEQDVETGKYRLGLKLFEMGTLVQSGMDLKAAAAPTMQQLMEEHGETVHLVIMDQGEVVYIDKRESPESMRIVSQVGRRLPAHCTGVGKAILAFLPATELESIISLKGLPKMTENTIVDVDELKAELERTRERGYALDNQEITEGLMCVAVPIRDYTGKVIAAISVAGPNVRVNSEKIDKIIVSMKQASRVISRRLGFSEAR